MRFRSSRICLPVLLLAAILPLGAQGTIAGNAGVALPETPHEAIAGPAMAPAQQHRQTQPFSANSPKRQAPRLAKYIEPNQVAAPLSAKDKLELSGWEQLQPYAFSTQIVGAGWQHLINGNPKYGTDKAGFGERLGSATIRQGSQAIFSDGILAAAFREDPRYYRKGSGKVVNRIAYAASRVLITRTDAGNETPNYSKIVGYAGASALTMTYYPAVSATWAETSEGYGISFLVAALGNGIHEFTPDLVHLVSRRYRRRRQR